MPVTVCLISNTRHKDLLQGIAKELEEREQMLAQEEGADKDESEP